MSLSLYCSILYSLSIFFSVLFGKVLIPESNSKYLEVLSINGKDKKYYEITGDGLEYNVKGPAEIKIFSKAAFPKKTVKEVKNFNFNISINELSSTSNNLKKIHKNTFSLEHPMHVYTYSAKDIITIPGGDYNIKIYKNSILDPPILVKLSRVSRKSKKISRQEFPVLNNFPAYELKNINNSRVPAYYKVDSFNPLFLNNIEGLFEFNIRGLHDSVSDSPEIINAKLLKNGKNDVNYHILSIPHPSTTLNGNSKIPSKLNKIYIKSSGNNYLLNLNQKDSEILIRVNQVLE